MITHIVYVENSLEFAVLTLEVHRDLQVCILGERIGTNGRKLSYLLSGNFYAKFTVSVPIIIDCIVTDNLATELGIEECRSRALGTDNTLQKDIAGEDGQAAEEIKTSIQVDAVEGWDDGQMRTNSVSEGLTGDRPGPSVPSEADLNAPLTPPTDTHSEPAEPIDFDFNVPSSPVDPSPLPGSRWASLGQSQAPPVTPSPTRRATVDQRARTAQLSMPRHGDAGLGSPTPPSRTLPLHDSLVPLPRFPSPDDVTDMLGHVPSDAREDSVIVGNSAKEGGEETSSKRGTK